MSRNGARLLFTRQVLANIIAVVVGITITVVIVIMIIIMKMMMMIIISTQRIRYQRGIQFGIQYYILCRQ